MRRGRIELTHELGRFQSGTIFSPGGLLWPRGCAAAEQKPIFRIAPSDQLKPRYKSVNLAPKDRHADEELLIAAARSRRARRPPAMTAP